MRSPASFTFIQKSSASLRTSASGKLLGLQVPYRLGGLLSEAVTLHCSTKTEVLPAAAATTRAVHAQNGSIASKLVVGTAEGHGPNP